MKYETPTLELLIVEEELFMALSVNGTGDARDDESLDFDGEWE